MDMMLTFWFFVLSSHTSLHSGMCVCVCVFLNSIIVCVTVKEEPHSLYFACVEYSCVIHSLFMFSFGYSFCCWAVRQYGGVWGHPLFESDVPHLLWPQTMFLAAAACVYLLYLSFYFIKKFCCWFCWDCLLHFFSASAPLTLYSGRKGQFRVVVYVRW